MKNGEAWQCVVCRGTLISPFGPAPADRTCSACATPKRAFMDALRGASTAQMLEPRELETIGVEGGTSAPLPDASRPCPVCGVATVPTNVCIETLTFRIDGEGRRECSAGHVIGTVRDGERGIFAAAVRSDGMRYWRYADVRLSSGTRWMRVGRRDGRAVDLDETTELPCHTAFNCTAEKAPKPHPSFDYPVEACVRGHHWWREPDVGSILHYGHTKGIGISFHGLGKRCARDSCEHGILLPPDATWATRCLECGWLKGSNGKSGLASVSMACACARKDGGVACTVRERSGDSFAGKTFGEAMAEVNAKAEKAFAPLATPTRASLKTFNDRLRDWAIDAAKAAALDSYAMGGWPVLGPIANVDPPSGNERPIVGRYVGEADRRRDIAEANRAWQNRALHPIPAWVIYMSQYRAAVLDHADTMTVRGIEVHADAIETIERTLRAAWRAR